MPEKPTRAQATVAAKLTWLSKYKGQFLSPSICSRNNIDLHHLDLEDITQSTGPLCFEPLTKTLLTRYPIDQDFLARVKKTKPEFLDIGEYEAMMEAGKNDPLAGTPRHVLWGLPRVLSRQMHDVARKHIPQGQGTSISDVTCWSRATYPENPVAGAYTIDRFGFTDWRHNVHTINVVENDLYPHVYELAYMLKAMEFRLAEGLFDKDQPQPVLMVSFMVPRHGRILHAHINRGIKLVISRSKMYSFENSQGAPFELFYRWFLGIPMGVQPRELPGTSNSEKSGSDLKRKLGVDENSPPEPKKESKKGKKKKQ
ncbi:uncharacterized protein BO80DRAFT_464347 [Aspergillus ibericus CBS 121593]|uniref:Uncharacterized protein n=1 Tax=Aspergillus ibericus CBS 121593 TaxID=1448316 RepID=A0A395H0T0_9EURO|nr:hypothetical protein BO80DRAFT_464347 [Aspergillus ibericus CBS 121593]RAL01416.1 hypothetical protein BO80DRAFT_464347 [Aspergillus ibericus CBS 121593]